MFGNKSLPKLDYLLFGASLGLAFFGVLGIYSAASSGSPGIFVRQFFWIILGVGVCLIVASVDYHLLVDHGLQFYLCSLGLLGGLLLFGTEINGSKSWIVLGDVQFQPSEIVKLAVILALAQYLGQISRNRLTWQHYTGLSAMILAPVVLIVLQGDLGTALTYLPILAGMTLLVTGLRKKLLLGMLVFSLVVTPLTWLALKDYQKQRILVTLDPDLDPQGIGYQTRQSRIAIGSGGLLGKGVGQGLQSKLGFVPEVHTDFIFALLAEEIGFVGASIILMLYLLVLMRLIHIAETARDRVGILIVTGVASLMFFHVVVNVGMTLGILPAIGIPLPLLSYGGSSIVTTFAALGLALSVFQRRFVY